MKYYFITYQGSNRDGSVSIWNDVIDISPMEFIKNITATEKIGSNTYYNFVILNKCKISKKEFKKYKLQF